MSSDKFPKLASNPLSFNIFSVSFNVLPNTSGVWTCSTVSSSVLVFVTSKYGKTSLKIWPPTGAATPPPCIMPHLLQSIF